MASLTARGAHEVARLEIRDTRSNSREEVAIRSDGTTLVKYTWFKADGSVDHSTGWRIRGHLKVGRTAEQWIANMLIKGYRRTK